MLVSVNKHTVVRRPVQYAALASGTISHVWSEDETPSKREVHVVARVDAKAKSSDDE